MPDDTAPKKVKGFICGTYLMRLARESREAAAVECVTKLVDAKGQAPKADDEPAKPE